MDREMNLGIASSKLSVVYFLMSNLTREKGHCSLVKGRKLLRGLSSTKMSFLTFWSQNPTLETHESSLVLP